MTSEQRRVVWAVCSVVGITFIVGASLTFLIEPIVDDLGLTHEEAGVALAIPSIASLLIVFAVGRLGDRIGHRRVLVAAGVPFVAGSVLVSIASSTPVLSLGLLLAGGSATAIQIVALGLLQVSIPEGRSRVSAFTSYGMVFPAIYLVVPVLTGAVVGVMPWRVVPAIWALLGVAIPALALWLIPRPGPPTSVGELWTPLLGGLVLAGLVEAMQRANDDGWSSPAVVAALSVALASLIGCALALRWLQAPSLSLQVLRVPTMTLLLSAVALVTMASTLTYVTLGLEYLYGLSVLAAALWLVPAQAAAVVGAKFLAGRLMGRWGTARAGQVTLVGFAVSLLTLVLMSATAPVGLLVGSAALFSLFGFASITIVNAAVMAGSPAGQAGMVSAFRAAASSLGSALGVVILGAAITAVVVDTSTAAPGQVPDPVALADGLRTNGVMGALIAVLAWVGLRWAMRAAAPTAAGAAADS